MSHPIVASPLGSPLPLRATGARAALASLGLAVHAAALTRVHSLTAGSVPAPSHLVAAGLLAGLALAASGPPPANARRRGLGLVAAALALVSMLAAPIALAQATGWIAATVTLVAALGVGWLVGRSGLIDISAPRLAFVAAGLAIAGLTLPLAGPLPLGLAAGILLALASLMPATEDVMPAASSERRGAGALAAEMLIGAGASLIVVALVLTLRGQISAPWPFGFFLAAGLLAGLAAAGFLARRSAAAEASVTARWVVAVVGVASLAAIAVALRGTLAAWAGSLPAALGLDLLAATGAAIALILLAAFVGLPLALLPGLVAGEAAPAPRLAGAAIGVAGAGALASALGDPLGLLLVATAMLAAGWLLALSGRANVSLRHARSAALAMIALELMLVSARWWRESPESRLAARHAGSGWSATVTSQGGAPRVLEVDAQPVATTDPDRAPSGRLAGHLAGLLCEQPRRVLIVGWPLPGLVDALASHGVETILVAEPLPGAHDAFPAWRDHANVRWIHAGAPAALPSEDAFDAVVMALTDPATRHAEAFFTGSGRAEILARVARDGVIVDIVDLDRLTPPDLFAHLARLRESLPDPVVFMADGGRSGLLVVASPVGGSSPVGAATPVVSAAAAADESQASPAAEPEPAQAPASSSAPAPAPIRIRDAKLIAAPIAPRDGQPFNLARLLDPARLTPAVQESLRAALLLTPAQLMATIVAGSTELDALGESAAPADAWTPGPRAFTFAPQRLARPLAQALFLGRLQVVDLPVVPAVLQGRGDFDRSVPFAGLDTRLGVEWSVAGRLRFQNRLAGFLGSTGVYRDRSRRVSFARPGRDLTLTERPLHSMSVEILQASMDGLASGKSLNAGTAILNGHPALWSFEQPSVDEQIIVATWHCPEAERLFGLRYRLTEGVKPGMFEEVLEFALGSVRCSHGLAARGDVTWQPVAPVESAAPPGPGG